MNFSKLNNKTILITGVSGSIGFDLCKVLLKNKSLKIIGLYSGLTKNQKIPILKKNKNFYTYKLDLNNIDQIESHCKIISKTIASPDIIINSAAKFYYKKLSSIKAIEILESYNVNIIAPIIITKFFIENMVKNKWGRIINICSSSSYNGGGGPKHCVYSSTKHALLGFSRALDEEYRLKNIRIGTVSPAGVKSKMTSSRKDILQSSLMESKEVTEAIMYLLLSSGKGIVYEMRIWRMLR